MYVVLVEVCKGSLIEVVTGMSIIHSLGVMSTDSTTAVERRIMTVDRVYDDERGHQAIGAKGRVISISGGGSGNQKRRIDYNNRAEEHHNMVSTQVVAVVSWGGFLLGY